MKCEKCSTEIFMTGDFEDIPVCECSYPKKADGINTFECPFHGIVSSFICRQCSLELDVLDNAYKREIGFIEKIKQLQRDKDMLLRFATTTLKVWDDPADLSARTERKEALKTCRDAGLLEER